MRCVPLALVVLTFGLFTAVVGAEPPAKVRASVTTKGDIWVGQRVTLVVELLAPGFFASAPAFDLPQVPGVILFPPEGRPVVGSETTDETTYTTQRHELAAYAQRAGRVEIPAFSVRFESSPAFGKPTVEQRVTTPAVALTAKMPPGAEGLSLVITTSDLKVTEVWEPQPGKGPAKLGAAFTRTITVEARGVPGMVFPAFRFDPPDGLGVYPKPPAVEDWTERGELIGRRVETVIYVCEKAGTFALPALVLAWWDPEEKKLKRVELLGRTFEVIAPPQPSAPDIQPAPDLRRTWAWIIGALAGLLGIGIAAWRLGPAAWTGWKRHREAAAASESAYFAAFERACRAGDAPATERGLLAWLDRFFADVPAPTSEGLAARATDPELTAELTALADAVYGHAPDASRPWSPSKLRRRVRAARSRLRRKTTVEHAGQSILPPLNPSG